MGIFDTLKKKLEGEVSSLKGQVSSLTDEITDLKGQVGSLKNQLVHASEQAAEAALGELVSPVTAVEGYVDDTVTLGKDLSNTVMSGLKGAGESAMTAASGAIGTISSQAGDMGGRLKAAANQGLMDVSGLASKLKDLPGISDTALTQAASELSREMSRLDLSPLTKLYATLKNDADSAYHQHLRDSLTQITDQATQITAALHVPIPNLDTTLVHAVCDVVDSLPAEARHLLAGLAPLDELNKALAVLKGAYSNQKLVNVGKKTLISTGASIYALSITLDSAATILPMTVAVDEETGVGADEEGGAGVAAGARGGAKISVGEEAKVGGGVTLISVGKWVCYLLSLLLYGIYMLLQQLITLSPTSKEA